MLLTMPDCGHRTTRSRDRDHHTCLACFRRLRLVGEPPTGQRWAEDLAPGPCDHTDLVPIAGFIDQPTALLAFCQGCGCIVSHPDAPGRWSPARDYSFRIHEAP